MWICLPMGMYMPALRPPRTVPADDNRLLQIRSRRRVDLDRLRRELLPELGETIHLPHTDYEFRAYCTHEQWARALAQAALDIDYVKFKEQSEVKYKDKKLHDVYTAMWYTVFSKMSTKSHQNDYWDTQNRLIAGSRRQGRQGKHRKAGDSRWSAEATDSTGKRWWEDAEDPGPRSRRSDDPPLLRDLINEGFGITEDDARRITSERGYSGDAEIDKVLNDWDNQPGNEIPVTRRPNGSIDHSYCKHEKSKEARRRCRRAANRSR